MQLFPERPLVAGVGDWVASRRPGAVLATYALGSCVGVTAWDPQAQVGGLLHFMLPDSTLNPERAKHLPGTFCDSGLARLLADMESLGASRRRLRVALAGGARALLGHGDYFDIGRRNHLAARRKLWELGLAPEVEACGGEISRTLKLDVDSGRILLRDPSGERELAGT